MFGPQCCDLVPIRRQLCRVGLAGQDGSSDNQTALGVDIADQVGEGPTLANEIIDHEIVLVPFDAAAEQRLMRQPPESVGSGMTDGIELEHRAIDGQ